MRLFLKAVLITAACISIIAAPLTAYTQALPATRLTIAVGKTIMTKMKVRGFAANDARYGATVDAASSTLTTIASTAASVGGAAAIGAVGAPVWLTIGASLAIGYGIQLALDNWMPNLPPPAATGATNPTMQVVTSTPVPSITLPIKVQIPNPDTTPNDPIFPDMGWYNGAGIEGIANYYNWLNDQPASNVNWIAINVSAGQQQFLNGQDGLVHALITVTWDQVNCFNDQVKPNCSGSLVHMSDLWKHPYGGHCPDGYTLASFGCVPPVTITDNQIKTGTPQDIANGILQIDQGLKNSPVNPELIAIIADAAWQRAAAMPGYQGVPYTASDPVTANDVSNAYSPENNPLNDPYPTVQDALNPVSTPGTTIAINLNPNSNGIPSNPSTDPGSDPSIPQPALEAIPTVEQILSPIINLLPSFKSYVVPQHAAECPRPSVYIFQRHIVLDGHCDLLELVRPTLYAVMAFVWVSIGLFILLAA